MLSYNANHIMIVRDCRSNLSFVEKNSSAENTAYMED